MGLSNDAKKRLLATRVEMLLAKRAGSALPKEESLRAVLASALVEAEKDCDCNVVSTWVEANDCFYSVVAQRPRPSETALLASAVASEKAVDTYLSDLGVSLTSFVLLNAQRKDALVAAVSGGTSNGGSFLALPKATSLNAGSLNI